MGETHLQASLLRGGMQGEDVENERRAVDDLHGLVHDLLEIRLLRWRKLIVEDHQIRFGCPRQLGNFLGLARADEGAGIRRVEPLRCGGHRIGPGGIGKARELGKGRF